MLLEILKALLVGILASIPPGPVAVLVLQKTFCYGRGAGYASGFGSAVIDTFYALASLFAVAMVENFISINEKAIMIIGGSIIILVGWSLLFRKGMEEFDIKITTKSKALQYALQSAGCAIANPGALAYMFALVALCRLDINETAAPLWLLVLMVFIGACSWWFLFVFLTDKLRRLFRPQTLIIISKVAGIIVIVFGAVLVTRGIAMPPLK